MSAQTSLVAAAETNVFNAESSVFSTVYNIWNFHLFNIDGSDITLGKVLISVFFVIFGYFFSRIASRYIGQKLIARFNMPASQKYTIERLTFYVVYVFVVLFVMQMLSIPITIFTMVGGAVAIGIGFGSQNVINNFISGLIVMVEQPVRVGDWIELDSLFGRVENIGSRSTYLLTLDNKQAIIPNSSFLEKMFTNWTLNDNLVIGSINIGVAYGSDTKAVKDLLLQAALEHKTVLRDPKPSVMFQDFGDSSLNFTLFFWISFDGDVTPKRVASDIRFRIDEMFREKGVNIPYPHRQLIINTDKPIPVSMQST